MEVLETVCGEVQLDLMPDLDTSTQGLWWLKPQDHGPDNTSANMINAAQISQRNRALNMQQQEQDALLPLRRQALSNQIEMQADQIHEAQNNMEYQKQVRNASSKFSTVYTLAGSLPDGWADPTVRTTMGQLAVSYPAIVDSPMWKEADKNITTALEQKTKLMQYNAELQHYKNMENAANRAALKDKTSPGMTAANEILDTQDQLDQANASGDIKQSSALTQKLQLLKDAYPAKGNEEMEMSLDSSGRPVFRMTRGGKSSNVATENFAQKNIIGLKSSIDSMDNLEKNLRPEDLGLRGVVGEFLGDVVIPQFDPTNSTFDPKRVKNRTDLKAGLESLVGQLTSDKRTSVIDRKRLEALGPSTGIFESEPRAKAAILAVKDVMKNRAKNNAQEAKLPIEEWMMTDQDIADAVNSGKITKAKGIELRAKYYPGYYK